MGGDSPIEADGGVAGRAPAEGMAALDGPIQARVPTVFASAGEAGGDFEMDAVGIRGGESHDRLTWSYVDRVELADVRWWYASTKVVGRYENLITIPARAFVPGSAVHPAELVRREAAARGIAIVGTRPVGTVWERLRAPLALLVANVVAAALLPLHLT